MRLGFRKTYLVFVLYMRKDWSLEIWMWKLGISLQGRQPWKIGWEHIIWS